MLLWLMIVIVAFRNSNKSHTRRTQILDGLNARGENENTTASAFLSLSLFSFPFIFQIKMIHLIWSKAVNG